MQVACDGQFTSLPSVCSSLQITAVVTHNLNRIIDVNYYPTEPCRRSNMRNRPIGIGVQGLADAFILLGLPFDSPEARQLNRDIFETIYFAALKASCELARELGAYESYQGSPVSKVGHWRGRDGMMPDS